MATWIDIPAHRVLEVEYREWCDDFEHIDKNGEVIINRNSIEDAPLHRRTRDGKLFKQPRFHVIGRDFGRLVYLEEA